MKYTSDNIKEGIIDKINSIDKTKADSGMKKNWCRKLINYPIEVEQNVLEWLNDEPITKVDCHGISIRHVLDACKLDDSWFPFVLENFISFKNNNYVSINIVYHRLL